MPYAGSDRLEQISPTQFVDPNGDLWEYDELAGFFKKVKKRLKKAIKRIKKNPLPVIATGGLPGIIGAAALKKKHWKIAKKVSKYGLIAGAGVAAGMAIGPAGFGAAFSKFGGSLSTLASNLVGKTGIPFQQIFGALKGMDNIQIEGIADALQSGKQLPPYILSLLANASRPIQRQDPTGPIRGGPAYPPRIVYPPGAFAPTTPRPIKKAGMFGDMPPWAVALLAASAAGALLMLTTNR